MQPQRLPLYFWLILLMPVTVLTAEMAHGQSHNDDFPNELGTNHDEPQIALPEHRSNSPFRLASKSHREASDDALVQLCREAVDTTSRRMLSTELHTPWQIMHALLGLREEFQILHEGAPISGLDWITRGQTFNNEYWFEPTRFGGRAHPYSVPYAFEGHANQFLAILSMCGVELDQQFGTATGTVTMKGMIQNAQMTVSEKDEPTWTLWALSRYLPSSASWRNAAGEAWSIEKLVQIQTEKPMRGAPCGGTHSLFALAHARNVYLRQGKPLRGVWVQAEYKIRQHINTARMQQNSNGTLSSNFFRSREYDPDFNKRMASAGHILEFLMISMPQKELNERWVRRAIEATARDLMNNRKAFVKCSPLYHSVNALNIYLDRVNPKISTDEIASVEESPRTAMNPRPADNSTDQLKSVPAKQISTSRDVANPEADGTNSPMEANSKDLPPVVTPLLPPQDPPSMGTDTETVTPESSAEKTWRTTPLERRSPISVPPDKVNSEPAIKVEDVATEKATAEAKPQGDSNSTPVESQKGAKVDELVDLTISSKVPARTISKSREADIAPESTVAEEPKPELTTELAPVIEIPAVPETKTATPDAAAENDDTPELLQPMPEAEPSAEGESVSSVPQGINNSFLDLNLDTSEWVQRFEVESREVFSSRRFVVDALSLADGMSIADVGTGTGLFVGLFAEAVGANGRVYAIDISPRLTEFVERRVLAEELKNVTVVRNDAQSLLMGNNKVDRMLVCDTYHHFEYHEAMLASMLETLRPGGELVLVDFDRIPGESRDWILQHVRADKKAFREEIVDAGFEYVEEVAIPGFDENYLLRFRKPVEETAQDSSP